MHTHTQTFNFNKFEFFLLLRRVFFFSFAPFVLTENYLMMTNRVCVKIKITHFLLWLFGRFFHSAPKLIIVTKPIVIYTVFHAEYIIHLSHIHKPYVFNMHRVPHVWYVSTRACCSILGTRCKMHNLFFYACDVFYAPFRIEFVSC